MNGDEKLPLAWVCLHFGVLISFHFDLFLAIFKLPQRQTGRIFKWQKPGHAYLFF